MHGPLEEAAMNRISKWVTTGAALAGASYGAYAGTAWLRYGRPTPPRGSARDERLDSFMPRYDVCERHAIDVAAPADVTLAAAKDLPLDDSRIVRAIFKGRELILRSRPDEPAPRKGLLEQMKELGWGVLTEAPHEIVMGAVTKPWDPNPVFRTISPDEFTAFDEPGYVKIVWTLRADATADRGATFRTETRAVATDAGARKKFRRYWSFLSPGIILIRAAMLPAVAKAADRAWRLEGDDVL